MRKIPSWAKNQVKSDYGDYVLAILPSGKWTLIWHVSLGIEDLLWAILREDAEWFARQVVFAPPDTYPTKAEALEHLIRYLQEELEENGWAAHLYEPHLKRARIAWGRASKAGV